MSSNIIEPSYVCNLSGKSLACAVCFYISVLCVVSRVYTLGCMHARVGLSQDKSINRKARNSNSAEVWDKYRIARNQLVSKLREAKSAYFNRLNPRTCKSFWQAIKNINKKESSIPTLKDDNSSIWSQYRALTRQIC